MRRHIGILFLFLLVSAIAGAQTPQAEKLEITLFYSPTCKACLELKETFLPRVEELYKDEIIIRRLDIAADRANLELLLSLSPESASTPSVLIGENLLAGKSAITQNLEILIEKYLKERHISKLLLPRRSLLEHFKKITLATIIWSGLIDGINPCAFAVIIFFISFLSVYGYRKREIIIVGSCYCLAVFITYVLLGVGFFKILYSLSYFYKAIKYFYMTVGGFCLLFAALSFYDYIKIRMGKPSGDLTLQLPKVFKKKIHHVVSGALREKGNRSLFQLAFVSLLIGFLISLLEAVCTGQVYLPTIVFILEVPKLRIKAFAYLLLYNLMFIAPLIVIFILSLAGVHSETFNHFLKRRLGIIKIFMALLFLSLGLLILFLS